MSSSSILCRIAGHDANRQKARHDMEDYWAPCRRCGVMLLRAQSGWRIPTREEVETHNHNLARLTRRPQSVRID